MENNFWFPLPPRVVCAASSVVSPAWLSLSWGWKPGLGTKAQDTWLRNTTQMFKIKIIKMAMSLPQKAPKQTNGFQMPPSSRPKVYLPSVLQAHFYLVGTAEKEPSQAVSRKKDKSWRIWFTLDLGCTLAVLGTETLASVWLCWRDNTLIDGGSSFVVCPAIVQCLYSNPHCQVPGLILIGLWDQQPVCWQAPQWPPKSKWLTWKAISRTPSPSLPQPHSREVLQVEPLKKSDGLRASFTCSTKIQP